MVRGRRGRPTRPEKYTILVVTKGAVTEMEYLNELARRANRKDPGIYVKVKHIPGAPTTVVAKLQSPQGDVSGYQEVWVVVDEDDNDLDPFLQECARLSRLGKPLWVAVVSRPCFETWLVAHYEDVRKYTNQDGAKAHLGKITGRGSSAKALPDGFPYDAMSEAVTRCRLPGSGLEPQNSLPPTPGSAMPHLIERLGLY